MAAIQAIQILTETNHFENNIKLKGKCMQNEDQNDHDTGRRVNGSVPNILENGTCINTDQYENPDSRENQEMRSCAINNDSHTTDSNTDSDVGENVDFDVSTEQKIRKQECCNREIISGYLWRGIRVGTQIFLSIAVFVCIIISKASFIFIANSINGRKDAKLFHNNQHSILKGIFVYQLVICLMIPDIIKLLNSLCQLLFYRRITSHKCYKQGTLKAYGKNLGSTVQLEKKKHWFKEYNYEIKHICLEFLQCNAMYIFVLTVFPVLTPLEVGAFSAGISIIPCMTRALCGRKDFSLKITVFYIIYSAIYCLGFSGIAFVIEYKILTLFGRSFLILTSISMLLFGLRWLSLNEKEQEKGISNISHVISCLTRILIAVSLTLQFYPDIGSITHFINEIKRNCGLNLTDEYKANQSHLLMLQNLSFVSEDIKEIEACIPYGLYIPFLVCIVTSFLSYHFAIVACRLRMQQTSFALPLAVALPCYVLFLFLVESDLISNENLAFVTNSHSSKATINLLFGSFVLLWICQLWSCRHIWKRQIEHLPKTSRLFTFPSYFGPFNDISLMNSRKQTPTMNNPHTHSEETNSLLNIHFDEDSNQMRPLIFVCATMWHETLEEMKILLHSILKLDYDHACRRSDVHSHSYKDDFDLDAHIFFDDAFEYTDGNDRELNAFVDTLHCAISDVAREHFSVTSEMKLVVNCTTPYGWRTVWTLPGKNKLTVHFKDKKLIRNNKRWSQVMYFNYILKQKVTEISKGAHLDRQHVEDNIFILTLDGDVSFTPMDVKKIFIKMQECPNIGAVTGRLVPCGSGPIIWFQKFEYAMGHWLWKTAEQVFGSVLCAPGCFSLYRGTAISNTGVMDTYSKIPSTPREHLQFDQGEDRWLCTLLLKEGYRVEYIADATVLTAAPGSIPEFLRQRRRWTSSIIANLLDLQECSNILRKHNSSISLFYIVYIFLLVGITTVTPAAVLLWLIEVSLQSLTIAQPWVVYTVTYAPFVLHFVVCFRVKSKDIQHNVTLVLTIFYACLMVFIFMGHISALIHRGVSRYWFVYLIPYLLPALLHISQFHNLVYIGIFYLLSPLCYVLLYTYCVCNLNDMSWGTREKKTANKILNTKNIIYNNETILNIYEDIQSDARKHSFFKTLKSLIIIKLFESLHKTKVNDLNENDSANYEESSSMHHTKFNNLNENANTKNEKSATHVRKPVPNIHSLRRSEKEFWENLIKETLDPIKIEDDAKSSLMKEFQICRNRWVFGYIFLNCGIMIFRKCLDILKMKLDITVADYTFKPFGFLIIFIFGFVTSFQLLGLVIFKYHAFLDKISRYGVIKQ